MTADVAVVVLAAGSGSRFGHARNKAYLPLAGRPVVSWSLSAAAGLGGLRRVLLVIAEHDREQAEDAVAAAAADLGVLRVELVSGGASRHASEAHALEALADDIGAGALAVVVIHDAARPLAATALFDAVVDAARVHGAALPGRRRGSLVATDHGRPLPGTMVAVQTPQAFRAAPLLAAYRAAATEAFEGTDTASCLERYSDLPVWVVPGTADNVKVTFAPDLAAAERLLAARAAEPPA